MQVRIADFGLSRDSDATATVNAAMSKFFAAPELLLSDDEDKIKRTDKSDIYAFGCLYYEVCDPGVKSHYSIKLYVLQIHFDSLPFGENMTSTQVVRLVIKGRRPDRLRDPPLSDVAWSLIETCWDQDPGRRPSIDEVVDTMFSWLPSQ